MRFHRSKWGRFGAHVPADREGFVTVGRDELTAAAVALVRDGMPRATAVARWGETVVAVVEASVAAVRDHAI